MAITSRTLQCLACGHEWLGSWDSASSMQPDSASCPECGNKNRVKPKHFAVTEVEQKRTKFSFELDQGEVNNLWYALGLATGVSMERKQEDLAQGIHRLFVNISSQYP